MQSPYFFQRHGHRLLGVHYPPRGAPSGVGVVFCNAFGKEFNTCLSHITNFARRLSSRGHTAFRFDYFGYADSEGEFDQATLDTMCRDTLQAIEELRVRAKVDRLVLIGVRLGASIALMTADRCPEAEAILWEPVADPWKYLYAELRQTVTMQTVLFRQVKITRDAIIENVLAGRSSSFGGYEFNIIDEGFPLGKALIQEAQQIDMATLRAPRRALVINIKKKAGPPARPMSELQRRLEAMGSACALEVVADPCAFWKYDPIYATVSEPLFGVTMDWLEGK